MVVASPLPAAPDQTAPPKDEARIASLHTVADLGHYLDHLAAGADAAGRVTDQLQRAAAAGRALEPSLGRQRTAMEMLAFGERLHRLQTDLAVRPTTSKLDALAQRIQGAPDANARRQLVAQYRQTSASLPELYRLSAMERLRTIDAVE